MITFKQFITEKDKEEFKSTDDIFASGEINSYVIKNLFDIRPGVKGEKIKTNGKNVIVKDNQFVIRDYKNINKLSVIDEEDFYSIFEPIRSNQYPDAEGFMQYKNAEEIEAIKYKGEDRMIKNEWGEKIILKNGDFLARHAGNPSAYFVLTSGVFNAEYKEK